MDGISITKKHSWNNLGSDDRFLINNAAYGREPEKALRAIIERESLESPAGQYAQMLLNVMPGTIKMVQSMEERQVLPMLITARNEELSLPQTVKTLMESAREFLMTHPDFHAAIIISNNASTDETTAAVAQVYAEYQTDLLKNHISIEVLYEGKPGKINGIRKGIKHIEERFGNKYSHIISGDADVKWDKGAVSALWKTAHPDTGPKPLLVGSNVTPFNKKNLWGFLEHVTYYGYGSMPPRNQGLFMKIVNGMGYLADKSTLHHWDDIPVEIGSDDTALSVLVGTENIAIAADAIVRYDLSEDWDNFFKIRGRHVRETYRIEKWLSEKYGEKKGLEMVSATLVTKALPMLDGFFKPTVPLEKLDGSAYQNIKKMIRHLQSVPFLNYPFLDIFVVLFYMPLIYIYLTYQGIRQLYHVSWWVALIGMWKKLYCSSYVTYLQNKDSKNNEPGQTTAGAKGILWNPALQRKNLESRKQKIPVLEFLSNNLNWAYASVLMIGTLILWFIFKNIFSAISKLLSSLAINIPAASKSINENAYNGLTGNNIKDLLETSGQIFYVISQNLLLTSLLLGLILYGCLFTFHAVKSIKIQESHGSTFAGILETTGKHFLSIAAFPFVILEKAILYPVATLSTVIRLIFKKRS